MFLKNAKDLIEEGVWDLAAFNLEQYCQLTLKYKLLVHTGAYPRRHSIVRLVRDLSSVSEELQCLLEDTENVVYLTKIDDAYIGARYLPRRYEEREVKGMLKFIEEVFQPIVEGV